MSVSERKATSGYITPLVDALRDSRRVDYFTWRRALFGPYEVFHFHWPEFLIRDSRFMVRTLKRALFRVLLLRLRRGGARVIRTVHNENPHESGDIVEEKLLRRLTVVTQGYVVLSSSTQTPPDRPRIHIPHGHYLSLKLPNTTKFAGRIIHFGALRPYKGIEGLLDAFHNLTDATLSLQIIGKAASRDLEATIVRASNSDPRIDYDFRFIPDIELAQKVAASAIAVLPYRSVTNSGSAIFAVSMGTPVLLPENPSTRELQESLGDDWIHLYSDRLDATDIRRSLERASAGGDVPPPAMADRAWAYSAAKHLSFYEMARNRDSIWNPSRISS